jgi:hypothetical protein
MNRLGLARDRVAVVAGLLAPFAVCLALVPFRDAFANTNAALLLVVVIVAVAANGHRLGGLLAAVSSAFWFDFFLTQPYERFSIASRDDIETALLLLLVGAAVSELAARGRQHRIIAITDEQYLGGIQHAAEQVAAGVEPLDLVRHVRGQLTSLLDLADCRFEVGTFLGNPPRLDADGFVRRQGVVLDVDQLGLPTEEIELRVPSGPGVIGRFMMTPKPGSAPSIGARRVAVILADQVGVAFARSAPRARH